MKIIREIENILSKIETAEEMDTFDIHVTGTYNEKKEGNKTAFSITAKECERYAEWKSIVIGGGAMIHYPLYHGTWEEITHTYRKEISALIKERRKELEEK